MPPIEARVKDLLDETRLVMLGAQLLLGLQYRAAFSVGFRHLPRSFQALDCAALLLTLATVGLLLATPSFHQIAEKGHATSRFISHATRALQAALPLLALVLGIDVAIGLVAVAGVWRAGLAGGGFVLVGIVVWHVVPTCAARCRERKDGPMEDKEQTLEARIVQGLTELRVVLPGAQALFGFQVIAVLTDRFGELSTASQAIHAASMGSVAIAIVLLIAPASYHRIAAGGNAEESVLRYTVMMMLPAEGLVALGLVGEAYVTVSMVSGNVTLAIVLSSLAAIGFAVLLYGVPLTARWRRAF
ncbi:MAG: DUF6328 family protein [Acetobacteraceae bacterium]